MVNIGVLTSSRADFGVYLPLLKKFQEYKEINISIIAFGTHLSNHYGCSVQEIINNGFRVDYAIPTLLGSDDEESISTSAALCSMKFSSFWSVNRGKFDLVLCLGDRYEMFAAVSAAIPFGVEFAHFYGGDSSLGAIDNVYRDCLTHMSKLHFTSTDNCSRRVKQLKNNEEKIETVGILSLDDITNLKTLSLLEFQENWNIDLNIPTILITFHPETVNSQINSQYASIVYELGSKLVKEYQLVFTMPNADTNGNVYREVYTKLKIENSENIHLIENFGSESYFTCMKYSKLMIGNTSSGISEAASFGKYFINVGDRQKGRETGENVICLPFSIEDILKTVQNLMLAPQYYGENIYSKKNSTGKIIQTILKYLK